MRKFSIHVRKPTKKGLVVIITLILVLIIASVGISFNSNPSKENPEAIITVANEIFRAFEPVQFLGEESKGDIVEYHWDFDDGNFSEEQNPVNTFNIPKWYNVTLVVTDKNQMESTSIVTIGIQLPDHESSDTRGPARGYLLPGWYSSIFLTELTHPNIGNPRIEAHLSVTNPIGSIQIIAVIEWYVWATGELYEQEFYRDEYTATGTDIDLDIIIEPDQLPEDIEGNMTGYARFGYYLNSGGDGGASLTTNAVFPVGELSPPWLIE